MLLVTILERCALEKSKSQDHGQTREICYTIGANCQQNFSRPRSVFSEKTVTMMKKKKVTMLRKMESYCSDCFIHSCFIHVFS